MVFNFVDPNLSGDPVDLAALFPPESPSTTSCDCTCTTKTLLTRVLAPASHVLAAPAINTGPATPNTTPLDISDVVSKSNLRSFTLEELQVATYNFSDKLRVGRGGCGDVYKGLLPDGSFVAMKRLSFSNLHPSFHWRRLEAFKAEIEIQSRVRHRNLVPAIGFCVSKRPAEYIIVYPFKVNGDLHFRSERIQSKPPFDWPRRKRIMLGAARGLLHLHNNRIIHRNIKPSNILVDENLEGCIGDVGVALVLDKTNQRVPSSEAQNHTFFSSAGERETATNCSMYEYIKICRIVGTFGYMPPEYAITGICSVKIDVFSFGVTILSVITGQKSPYYVDVGSGKGISWIKSCLKENKTDEFVDPDLLNNYNEEDVKKLIQLVLACTLEHPEKRPSMFQVVKVLEGACLKDIGIDTDYIMRNNVQALEVDNVQAYEDYESDDESDDPKTDSAALKTDSTARLRPDELSGPR